MTKTFTATVLARMVLTHQVGLNDPVARYLPASVRVPAKHGKQITLLNLATQHSGLPRLPTNFDAGTMTDPYANYPMKRLYAFLDSYALPRDPGESYEYSNLGFGLLGLALARVEKTSYARLVQQQVLVPLARDGRNSRGRGRCERTSACRRARQSPAMPFRHGTLRMRLRTPAQSNPIWPTW